jgi:hypothetical protein
MIRLFSILLLAALAPALAADILLAGEPVRRNAAGAVVFTEQQLRGSAATVREGLVRWVATADGARIFDRFARAEYAVVVIEDPSETGAGRAPQPGIATFLAAGDRTVKKTYELILNPSPRLLPDRAEILPDQAVTPADFAAAAWAAEMLHVSFYADGRMLPHHDRADFQEAWRSVAAQLGFPAMTHGEEPARRARVTTLRR